MTSQKSAIGLFYDGQGAPEVSSKGFGELAEHIIQYAKDNDILLHQDSALTESLAGLEIGQQIPEELYYVIAELIAFSYVLQGKFPPGWQALHNKLDVKA